MIGRRSPSLGREDGEIETADAGVMDKVEQPGGEAGITPARAVASRRARGEARTAAFLATPAGLDAASMGGGETATKVIDRREDSDALFSPIGDQGERIPPAAAPRL